MASLSGGFGTSAFGASFFAQLTTTALSTVSKDISVPIEVIGTNVVRDIGLPLAFQANKEKDAVIPVAWSGSAANASMNSGFGTSAFGLSFFGQFGPSISGLPSVVLDAKLSVEHSALLRRDSLSYSEWSATVAGGVVRDVSIPFEHLIQVAPSNVGDFPLQDFEGGVLQDFGTGSLEYGDGSFPVEWSGSLPTVIGDRDISIEWMSLPVSDQPIYFEITTDVTRNTVLNLESVVDNSKRYVKVTAIISDTVQVTPL